MREELTSFPNWISREQWGHGLHLEQGWLRTGEQPKPLQPQGIVLHHTEPNDRFNHIDHQTCQARVRYWFDTHTEKWSDIAYHFLICTHGHLFEGRTWQGETPIQGAHALGNNDRSLGVVLLGNLTACGPSEKAHQTLERLLLLTCRTFSIDPREPMEWNFVDEERRSRPVSCPSLVGHRDIRSTECPGECFYPYLADLRANLAKELGMG